MGASNCKIRRRKKSRGKIQRRRRKSLGRARRSRRKCGSRPRRRVKITKKYSRNSKKCSRRGKITSNAFLNFMRCYRRRHCGKLMSAIAIKGGKVWNKMDEKSKSKYAIEALKAMKRKKIKQNKPVKSICGQRRPRKSKSRTC